MTGGEGACLDLDGGADEQARFGDGLKVVSAQAGDPRELFLELRVPISRYLVSLGSRPERWRRTWRKKVF